MLSFRNRFHGHGSLKYVYKNGYAIRTNAITLKYVNNPRRKTPRVSVVVSKKTLKAAVGRNRIRRRMYEIIRQELPKIKPDTDLVFLVFQADIRTQPYEELVDQVRQLLNESGLYK